MGHDGRVLPFPKAPDGIELRHLRAFIAVADELSFARAADRLYLTAGALSRQIASLEQLLGSELFRRSTRSVELTVAGEALLQRAREILRGVDEAVAETLAVSGESIARITKLWSPIAGQLGEDGDLDGARAAGEELLAKFPPPPQTAVRPTTAGGVPSLLVSPDPAPAPTVLYLHGGGYVSGSAYGYRASAGALAMAAGAAVLVPDYRLAPEHPFPAALDDAHSAYLWLRRHAPSEERVVVVGDSSGAGLVLSLLLGLKRQGGPLPAAAVLQCPALFLAPPSGESRSPGTAPVEATDPARQLAALYLGAHPAEDPRLDPLSADLHGLPPMLIQAATGDRRFSDAQALAARARDDGVDAHLDLYPVDAHGFHLFWSFLPEATAAIELAGGFIRDVVEGAAGEDTSPPTAATQ